MDKSNSDQTNSHPSTIGRPLHQSALMSETVKQKSVNQKQKRKAHSIDHTNQNSASSSPNKVARQKRNKSRADECSSQILFDTVDTQQKQKRQRHY